MFIWKVDLMLTNVYEILYRLGAKASIQGFFETSASIFLAVRQLEFRPYFSIMEIYQEISALYHTNFEDIDPRIRRTIQRIWKQNPELLSRIAGRKLEKRPTPKQFIEIVSQYLMSETPL